MLTAGFHTNIFRPKRKIGVDDVRKREVVMALNSFEDAWEVKGYLLDQPEVESLTIDNEPRVYTAASPGTAREYQKILEREGRL